MTQTTQVIPEYYDSLDLSLAEAREQMEHGARLRRSAMHTPVLASIDKNGYPTQRILILRAVDWASRKLRFHTDRRSEKVQEFNEIASASVLFYDPETKIQLRLNGTVNAEIEGPRAEEAWQHSTLFARRCYLALTSPGRSTIAPTSGLSPEIEGIQPSEDQIAQGRDNFAILLFQFQTLEWLYLANAGHRRAIWEHDLQTSSWAGSWLIP